MAKDAEAMPATQDILSTPARLAASIRARAAQAEKIYSVSFLCHPQTPAKITCMIGVAPEYANAFAVECRGQVFGFTMVVAATDVPPAFTCARRPQIPSNCSCVPAYG